MKNASSSSTISGGTDGDFGSSEDTFREVEGLGLGLGRGFIPAVMLFDQKKWILKGEGDGRQRAG